MTARTRIATLAVGALAAAALTGLTAAGADASSSRATGTLTSAARSAGVTSAGGGYMGWSSHTPAAQAALAARPTTAPALTAAVTPGIDVASYQGNVNWASYWSAGKKFAYAKATEGTSYTNPYFSQQYSGSYGVGMFHGAYHFALPSSSAGATQADYFVAHGGGWSRDGRTLPGALDIEYNPYGATCYGLSAASMVSWISAFVERYKVRTGVYPVIYSTYDWWATCTGNSRSFSTKSPIWIARYSSSAGTLPAGYSYYTFWQYSSSPIDQDYFNGDAARLKALSLG